MFSQSVTYTDYNGEKKTQTLWFHLARKAAVKDIAIADEIDSIDRILKAEKHELTTAEKQLILDFLVKIIKMSYGLRSEDGTRFKQNQEVFEAFEETAAYDQFLTDLFVPDPAAAWRFIMNTVPADVRGEIETNAILADAQRVASEEPELAAIVAANTPKVTHVTENTVSVGPLQVPKKRLQDMTREELEAAFRLKTSGS